MEERTKEQSLLTAEELIKSPYASYRDRGRHILMELATTDEEWQALAFRFTSLEFNDLRNGVIDHFLKSAPKSSSEMFVRKMVVRCKICIRDITSKKEIYGDGSKYMHWILNCLSTLGNDEMLTSGISFLQSHFRELPIPIQKRLKGFHFFAPL